VSPTQTVLRRLVSPTTYCASSLPADVICLLGHVDDMRHVVTSDILCHPLGYDRAELTDIYLTAGVGLESRDHFVLFNSEDHV